MIGNHSESVILKEHKHTEKEWKRQKRVKVVKDPNGERPPWEKWAGLANQGGDSDATHLSRNNTVSEDV